MKRIRMPIMLGILSLLILTAPLALASRAVPAAKMLFFYQDGCRWCAQMDKVLREPKMERLLYGHAQVFRINIQGRARIPSLGRTGVDLARKFKVYGTPTIIVVGRDEKVLLRIPGALSKEDFQEVVSQYVPGVGRK